MHGWMRIRPETETGMRLNLSAQQWPEVYSQDDTGVYPWRNPSVLSSGLNLIDHCVETWSSDASHPILVLEEC